MSCSIQGGKSIIKSDEKSSFDSIIQISDTYLTNIPLPKAYAK